MLYRRAASRVELNDCTLLRSDRFFVFTGFG